jgi:hypothetical protein
MKSINAEGRLRHRFLGTYSACIGLRFGSPEDRDLALPILQSRLPTLREFQGVSGGIKKGGVSSLNGPQGGAALVIECGKADMEAVKDCLQSLGAVRQKIDSMRTSVDFGEPFTISIPIPE